MASAAVSTRPTDSLLERTIWYMGGLMTFHVDSKDTNGALAMVEVNLTPGSEPPLHIHEREDEIFYVLEGELEVTRGSETLTIGACQSGFLPRGIPHTFKILSSRVRALVCVTPAGFEEFFRSMGRPAEAMTPDPNPAPLDIPYMVSRCAELGVTFVR